MPTLSIFYGIEVRMFWSDHPPPHFHVSYAGHLASIDIVTFEFIAGTLPRGARLLVLQWAEEHQQELLEAFDLCSRHVPPQRIAPLP
jgi:hypothetical protein